MQKSETLHGEHPKNDKTELADETKLEIYSSPKITSASSKIKSSSRIIAKRHPESQVIGDIEKGILTRRKAKIGEQVNIVEHFFLISDFEPNREKQDLMTKNSYVENGYFTTNWMKKVKW